MDDTVKFIILLAIGAIGVFFAFSIIQPGVLDAFGGGTGGSLSANVLSVVGSARSDDGAEGEMVFYASYDNLQNIHPVRIKDAGGARITNVRTAQNGKTIFIGTTRGLFVSLDGGLNYKPRSNFSSEAIILDVIEGKSQGEYFISVYENSRGALYRTDNDFFTIEKITDFQREAVYAMYLFGDDVYIGMSNGQLLRYNLTKKVFETLSEFDQQVTGITYASDNFMYILLKNGTLYRGAGPYGDFRRVRIPGGSLFSAASILQFADDERGAIYIRTKSGIYRSTNSGASFALYDQIPLLANAIDTFGVQDGNIYILSAGRLYTSSYAGVEWSVREVPSPRPLWQSYFMGGGRVILTQ